MYAAAPCLNIPIQRQAIALKSEKKLDQTRYGSLQHHRQGSPVIKSPIPDIERQLIRDTSASEFNSSHIIIEPNQQKRGNKSSGQCS
ncbi:uncharacterized protein J3R85_004847 [Psidium guajava]|nr:uncharacterized protein J3R85_004847 [Psidium guajava]